MPLKRSYNYFHENKQKKKTSNSFFLEIATNQASSLLEASR